MILENSIWNLELYTLIYSNNETIFQKGEIIGEKYKILTPPLVGGMGEVYICLDIEDKNILALKTIKKSDIGIKRFDIILNKMKGEITNWIEVSGHPNIVKCYFLKVIDNQPFIISEYIYNDKYSTPNLRNYCKKISLQKSIDILVNICHGMIYASNKKKGIVHCDLKPDNILVDFRMCAKITDFGLSKIASSIKQFDKSNVCGSSLYMSPEQWLNKNIDHRTDIYATGCILIELLEGRPPFIGNSNWELQKLHVNELPDKFIKRLNTPKWIKNILKKTLEKEIDKRYNDFNALLHEISFYYEKEFNTNIKPAPSLKDNNYIELFYKGVTYERIYEYKQAIFYYNKAISLENKDPNFYVNRGNCYSRLKLYEKAFSDYEKAIKLNSNNASAFNNRGFSFIQLTQYKLALEDFNKAIQLDSNYAQAYTNRGFIYYHFHDINKALADFNKAIEVDPKYAKAYHNIAGIADQFGYVDVALHYMQKAVSLGDPLADDQINIMKYRYELIKKQYPMDNYSEKLNFAIGLIKLKHFDNAISLLKKLIKNKPNFFRAYYHLGLTFQLMDKYAEAIQEYDQTLTLSPEYTYAIYNKAECLNALGNKKMAAEYYNMTLKIDGNRFGDADNIRTKIKVLGFKPKF